jgi:hypothetical protein
MVLDNVRGWLGIYRRGRGSKRHKSASEIQQKHRAEGIYPAYSAPGKMLPWFITQAQIFLNRNV